ncbi:MFS transporter [Actinospica robiniae]|uniref:MFS transporter n=1 Tax=Actinospica robiniae TaxID=304901 RepID=UPI0003FCFE84|nr:MFS transporter [Actinospica robiniae]
MARASEEPAGEPEAAIPPASRPSLWRNRDYMAWWTGETLSMFGTSMSSLAFPLLVLFTTGSATGAGVIAGARQVGTLTTTLWGGALADRVSRKLLLVSGPLVEAAVMAVVAFDARGPRPSIALLAGAGALAGIVGGLYTGAVRPAMRRIVPLELFAARTAQEQGRDMAAELVANPVAAILFTVARWIPFAGDAVSFLFSALGAAAIRTPLGPEPVDRPQARGSITSDMREGFRFLLAQPFLRYMLIWGALVNMVGNVLGLLFIALMRYRGGGPRMIGLAGSVMLVMGVAGALLTAQVIKRLPLRPVFVGIGWVFMLGLVACAVVPQVWGATAVLSLTMLLIVPLNAITSSYSARLIPDALTGRINSAMSFGSQSLVWLGYTAFGWLADRFGPPTAMLCAAAFVFPLALAPHVVRSLDILRTPVDQVREFSLPAQAGPAEDGPRPADRSAEIDTTA